MSESARGDGSSHTTKTTKIKRESFHSRHSSSSASGSSSSVGALSLSALSSGSSSSSSGGSSRRGSQSYRVGGGVGGIGASNDDAPDPPDDSPLRRTVTTRSANGHHHNNNNRNSITGITEATSTTHAGDPSNAASNRAYSTMSLGLRSFSNPPHALTPAQRLAKDSLPSPPATSKGGESEQGSIGSANSAAIMRSASDASTTRPGRHSPLDRVRTRTTANIQLPTAPRDTVNEDEAMRTARPADLSPAAKEGQDQVKQPGASSTSGHRSRLSRDDTEERLGMTTVAHSLQGEHRSPDPEILSGRAGLRAGRDSSPSDSSLDVVRPGGSSGTTHSIPSIKGKGRADSLTQSRQASVSISKIRKSSEAARQRVSPR